MAKLNSRITLFFVAAVVISTVFSFLYRQLAYGQTVTDPSAQTVKLSSDGTEIIELDDPIWAQRVPLQTLVQESRIIVIGSPVRNGASRKTGETVSTDYVIRVTEVIKGHVRPDDLIPVSMPGGLVNKPDGTRLMVRAREIRKMLGGRSYVMFLSGSDDRWAPLRGSQGLYEIPSNGTRMIHLGRSWDLPPSDNGEEVSSFLRQLRNLVRGR